MIRKLLCVATALMMAVLMTTMTGAVTSRQQKSSYVDCCEGMSAAASDIDPIMETPEGKVSTFKRNGVTSILAGMYATWGDYDYVCGQIVAADDGSVYIKDIVSQFITGAYVKGTSDGETITVELPQPIRKTEYVSFSVNRLVLGENGDYVVDTANNSVQLKKEGENWILDIPDDKSVLLGVCMDETFVGCGDVSATYVPFDPQVERVPDNLSFEKWQMKGDGIGKIVDVAFDGEDIYIRGISTELPQAVVKGHISGNQAIFPSRQYLGVDNRFFCFDYFCPASMEIKTDGDGYEYVEYTILDEAVFEYSDGEMAYDQAILINGAPDYVTYLEAIARPAFSRMPEDMSYIPMAPTFNSYSPYDPAMGSGSFFFNIVNQNIDGYFIDNENLYFRIFEDNEPVALTDPEGNTITDFPYGAAIAPSLSTYKDIVFYYFTIDGLETLGAQAVYKKDGMVYESETMTYDCASGEVTVGISDLQADKPLISRICWFDMMGNGIDADYRGICIRQVFYSDGSIESQKVYRK